MQDNTTSKLCVKRGGGGKELESSPTYKRGFFLYFSIIFVYCVVRVIFARYTFNLDDIWMWLDIYHLRPIFNGYSPESGRFFPLASLDLNLLMLISTNPYLFFVCNAIVVLLLGFVVWVILQMVLGSSALWVRIVVLLFILLHPGFVTTMVGICYPERLQMLFLGLFVLFSLRFCAKPTILRAIVGFASANIAIYYKEPTFLMIACFGIFGFFVGAYRHYARWILAYYVSLIISAVVYVCIYLVAIYPKITSIYSRNTFDNAQEEWLAMLKGLFNLASNDVLLFVLLPSLVLYRIYRIVYKKSPIMLPYDALMMCGLLYLGAFLKLKLFENYYLMPIYIISFSAVVHFLFMQQYMKLLFFKLVSIACVVVFVINTAPLGINTFAFLKSEGVKLHSALSFIAKEAKAQPSLRLYFDGNGEDRKKYATWYWGYFDTYLKELYDTHNVSILFDESKLASGDYIMLNASTNKMVDSTYLGQMGQRYELVYKSSAFGLPYIGLKPMMKMLFGHNAIIKQSLYDNANIFRLPIHDYIYKVPPHHQMDR